jgi:hypothetical protein
MSMKCRATLSMDELPRLYRLAAAGHAPGPVGVFDGVRINQPFGDVVSWDLIPKAAIASMNMMPGSNPCSASTPWAARWPSRPRKGVHPGTSVQVTGGSYGRRSIEFEHGGFNDKAGVVRHRQPVPRERLAHQLPVRRAPGLRRSAGRTPAPTSI